MVVNEGIAEAAQVSSPSADFGDFDWKKQWYPVAFDEYTEKEAPFAFTLLGERLVLWWDHKDGAWSAMRDVCPHRLAPLSEGRINDQGDIECPYHGWSFDGETGACTSIPQSSTPEKVSKDKRACGTALHTALEQGIIWVWAEPIYPGQKAPDPELIPICPAFATEGVTTDDISVDIPYDYTLLLENVMDISHVPFTHHGTQGKRNFARPINYKVKEALKNSGFLVESAMEQPPALTTDSTDKTAAVTVRPPSETFFRAPCYQHTKIQLKGLSLWIVTYAVPTIPGQCRLLARFPVAGLPKVAAKMRLLKPTFLRHMMRNQVLEDDNIFLHAQERELAIQLGGHLHTATTLDGEPLKEAIKPGAWASAYYLATNADTPVVLWRRWLDRTAPLPWAPGTPVAKYFDLTSEKERLLDRRKSHLNHCLSCQKAERMLKVVKVVVAAVAAALVLMSGAVLDSVVPSLSLLTKRLMTWVLLGICGGAYFGLGILQSRLVQGPYPPTRNLRSQR